MEFKLDFKHIIGALIIASMTWLGSTFFAGQSELVILKQQMEVVSKTLSEIRQDQREAQKLFALKTDLDRIEKRIDLIESKKR